MEMPTPVPVGALQAMLARSKQVMQQVEAKNPVKQKGSDRGLTETYTPEPSYSQEPLRAPQGYDENDEKEMLYSNPQAIAKDPTQVSDYTDDQVMNSGLPENIKEAMLKQRIPKITSLPTAEVSPHAISLMQGMFPKAQGQPQPQVPQTQAPRPLPLNESKSNMISVSVDQLQAMIKEGIADYFKGDYEKRITEAAIKKTINVLIREGKISTKK